MITTKPMEKQIKIKKITLQTPSSQTVYLNDDVMEKELKKELKTNLIAGFIMLLFFSNIVFIAMLATSKGDVKHLTNVIAKKDSIHHADSLAINAFISVGYVEQ